MNKFITCLNKNEFLVDYSTLQSYQEFFIWFGEHIQDNAIVDSNNTIFRYKFTVTDPDLLNLLRTTWYMHIKYV